MITNGSKEALGYDLPLSRPGPIGVFTAVGPNVDTAAVTQKGRTHDRNEDQVLIADLTRTMVIRQTTLPVAPNRHAMLGGQAKLLIVADGVGGGPAADVASAVAVDTLAYKILTVVPWVLDHDGTADELRDSVRWCAAKVREIDAKGEPATTLTAAVLAGDMMHVVHAGDSRCYLYRGGHLEQLTRDHTLARILDDEARSRPGVYHLDDETRDLSIFRHVLCNAVGYGPAAKLQVQLERTPLARGDVVLLCTDGLTNRVSDAAIAGELRRGASAQAMADALLRKAVAAGETDDITVAVARI